MVLVSRFAQSRNGIRWYWLWCTRPLNSGFCWLRSQRTIDTHAAAHCLGFFTFFVRPAFFYLQRLLALLQPIHDRPEHTSTTTLLLTLCLDFLRSHCATAIILAKIIFWVVHTMFHHEASSTEDWKCLLPLAFIFMVANGNYVGHSLFILWYMEVIDLVTTGPFMPSFGGT